MEINVEIYLWKMSRIWMDEFYNKVLQKREMRPDAAGTLRFAVREKKKRKWGAGPGLRKHPGTEQQKVPA